MIGRWRLAAVLALVAIALAACSPSDGGSATGAPAASVSPEARAAVDAATSALATELGVDASAVTVVSVTARDWPDTSLGCPESGMMYSQVITPGFAVVLEAEGTSHEYHTDGDGQQLATCTG